MGDNELIEEVVSPTESQSVDLSPIINSLNDLIEKQGEIVSNQQKIIDFFVPSDEELKQEKLNQEKLEQENLELLEQEKLEQEELYSQYLTDIQDVYSSSLDDIKQELVKLNDNTFNSVEYSSTNVGLSYILVFGLLFSFVIYFLYSLIRKFY